MNSSFAFIAISDPLDEVKQIHVASVKSVLIDHKENWWSRCIEENNLIQNRNDRLVCVHARFHIDGEAAIMVSVSTISLVQALS